MLTGRNKILYIELRIKKIIYSLFTALPKSHYPGPLSNGVLGGKKGRETHGASKQHSYRKPKLLCGCYKFVDKVNYNLVASLSQGCDNLVTTLWWPWYWNCNPIMTTLSQGCHKIVTRWKVEPLIWHTWGLLGGVLRVVTGLWSHTNDNFITFSSAYENILSLAIRNELKNSLYTIFQTIVEFLAFIFNELYSHKLTVIFSYLVSEITLKFLVIEAEVSLIKYWNSLGQFKTKR